MEEIDDHEIQFLFDIVTEVKYFYEFPVIFVTKKDFGDCIFDTLCKLRRFKLEMAPKEDIMDTIAEFNLQWLQSIIDVENFKARINLYSKEEVCKIINFSIDSLDNRLKYLRRYIDNYKLHLKGEIGRKMEYEMEITEAMNVEVRALLLDKLSWARNLATECELTYHMENEACHLLSWLDKINDKLSVLITKYFEKKNSNVALDLVQPLKQIVFNLKENEVFVTEINSKHLDLIDMIRGRGGCAREARIICDIINDLGEPIKEIGKPCATAALALVNKKLYLENKLKCLNKSTLAQIFDDNDQEKSDECVCYEAKIFNHLLPISERERLVTELCVIWDKVFSCPKSRKSIISILSAASVQEEFEDDLGTFFVDRHGRKIYRQSDSVTLYQQNEENQLVPLSDDDNFIYFYDECGRYYIDKTTQERIYKANDNASEYILGPSGCLLKYKEERDGITFYYDSHGRYFIDKEGKRIYREIDSTSEYEQDGYGNLVRIRSSFNIFEECGDDAQVSEDSAYLKQTVGLALRECLASVVLHQPTDPIKYLSAQLRIFKDNMNMKEINDKNKVELLIERNIRALEEQAAADRAALEAIEDGVSEASYVDSNLANYKPINVDADDSN